jgi:hypothetical protein
VLHTTATEVAAAAVVVSGKVVVGTRVGNAVVDASGAVVNGSSVVDVVVVEVKVEVVPRSFPFRSQACKTNVNARACLSHSSKLPASLAEMKLPNSLQVNLGANVVVVLVVLVIDVLVTVVAVTVVVVNVVGVVVGDVVGVLVAVVRLHMSTAPSILAAIAALIAFTPLRQWARENESTAPTCSCACSPAAVASSSNLPTTASINKLAIRPAVRSLSTLNVLFTVASHTTFAVVPVLPSNDSMHTLSIWLRREACTSHIVSPGTSTLPKVLQASWG